MINRRNLKLYELVRLKYWACARHLSNTQVCSLHALLILTAMVWGKYLSAPLYRWEKRKQRVTLETCLWSRLTQVISSFASSLPLYLSSGEQVWKTANRGGRQWSVCWGVWDPMMRVSRSDHQEAFSLSLRRYIKNQTWRQSCSVIRIVEMHTKSKGMQIEIYGNP